MYDPKDEYIQRQIRRGIQTLKDAIQESTNKQQTKEDILRLFCKELFDPANFYTEDLNL